LVDVDITYYSSIVLNITSGGGGRCNNDILKISYLISNNTKFFCRWGLLVIDTALLSINWVYNNKYTYGVQYIESKGVGEIVNFGFYWYQYTAILSITSI